MKRRTFIHLSAMTSAAISASGYPMMGRGILYSMSQANDDFYKSFQNPGLQYYPYVRWWWNGDRVNKTEVLRELDVMKQGGIGGVEINPIRWPQNADTMGIKELTWGSDEWLDVVEAAVKGAKEKGIVCDMIVGSGWPYGGEFVPKHEQCQMIALGTKDLEGGRSVKFTRQELLDSIQPGLVSSHKGSTKELFMMRLSPDQVNALGSDVSLDHLIHQDEMNIQVPAGNHVLYFLVKITGFASVIQGALGANGPVINHYDQNAVLNYLNRFGNILTSRLGALHPYFRAFFTDSIELEGANWVDDLFAQFQDRRGYDVKPYYPYVLFKTGEMGNAVNEIYGSKFSDTIQDTLNRVRYDLESTKHELFQERFVKTFADWCHQQGVQSRMQAYGMDCDAIDASRMIDIPECETWIWSPEVTEFDNRGAGRNYTMINKFVSSAAHLAGKQHISCEEMTNTEKIFWTTLERIKVTGDQSNLSGVTHSILHGFNYSPVDSAFPGWIRYGSYLNERNPWWPYFRLWSDYKARVSYVLENSVQQADVAILHPLADMASKYGFQRDPFPKINYPDYVHRVWEAVHQCGNGCDYVNETILRQSTCANGAFAFNHRNYTTLILIEVESINLSTADFLKRFADAGGKIVFVGKTPHLSSGLNDSIKQGTSITKKINQILTKNKSNAGKIDAPSGDMIAWYQSVQSKFKITPYIKIDKPVIHVNQNYYKSGDKDIFFFVNYSAGHDHSFNIKFNSNKTPWLWNAESGERKLLQTNSQGDLSIHLEPAESKIIVFDNESKGAGQTMTAFEPKDSIIIQIPWKVDLHHVNGVKTSMMIDTLIDLRTLDAYKTFAGEISYYGVWKSDQAVKNAILDLGKMHDITSLEINGKPVGSKWYGHHTYELSNVIQSGDNYLSIKVITTLGNYLHTLKNNKIAMEWDGDPMDVPVGLVNEVKVTIW